MRQDAGQQRAGKQRAEPQKTVQPRTVDHDQRRAQIVRATWRIIARQGMAGATMRQIAHEAGFANGAIKPYFPTKADLLAATYKHVFVRTNERIRVVTDTLTGIDALTALCGEILPLDANRLDEARVVIEFWSAATNGEVARELFEETMREWRRWMLEWCVQIDAARSWEAAVDALITFLQGSQVAAVLMPNAGGSAAALESQLEWQLRAFASASPESR